MSNDVAFRRINGRIVPIRLNKQRREQIKGAAIAGAGAAVAVGGGSFYKRAVSKSAELATKAFEALTPSPKQFTGMKHKFKSAAQMNFDDFIAAQPKVKPDKVFKAANRLAKMSGAVRKLAPVIGGGLFAYGATKFLNNSKKDQLDPDTAALLGAGAAQSLPYAIKKGQQLFDFGLIPRQQKMAFAKSATTEAVKKFATKAFQVKF